MHALQPMKQSRKMQQTSSTWPVHIYSNGRYTVILSNAIPDTVESLIFVRALLHENKTRKI